MQPALMRGCFRRPWHVYAGASKCLPLRSGSARRRCSTKMLIWGRRNQRKPASSSMVEDWDTLGGVETFVTGQTTVAIVYSGLGACKVVAPVRCTRSATSCAFRDTAGAFSCVHALRARSVPRGGAGNRGGAVDRVSEAVDGCRSRLPIALYNCPSSVAANVRVCAAMQKCERVVFEAPSECPKCKQENKGGAVKKEFGTILCTAGYCAMEIQSFYCSSKDCMQRVYPEGRSDGVVFWSVAIAATAVLMRDMAREMTTSGSTFGACHRHWHNKYVDLRDSRVFPAMEPLKEPSRQTATNVFFWTVELMVMEPLLRAFRCSVCQYKDGRWRIITADGIWLGYLKRLASGVHVNPVEACTSVKKTVEAASLHPSEWVRRFVRTALKQPSKPVTIKAGQLDSACRALALLCPSALPGVSETLEKQLGLSRLRAVLAFVWDLDAACQTLCDAIVTHLNKLVTQTSTLPEDVIARHHSTLQDLSIWRAELERGVLPAGRAAAQAAAVGVPGGVDGAAPAGVVLGGDGCAVGVAGRAAAGAAAPLGGGAVAGIVAGGGGPEAVGVAGGGGAGAPAPLCGGAVAGGVAGGGGPAAVGVAGAGGAGAPAPFGGQAAAVGARGAAGAAARAARVGGAAVAGAAVGGGAAAAGRRAQPAQRRGSARARGPAGAAQARHMNRETNEPGDPRCMRPWIKGLGVTLCKDLSSLCVALAIDPVVNAFKERHCFQLESLANMLRLVNGSEKLNEVISRCADDASAPPDDEGDAAVQALLNESRMLLGFLSAISSYPDVFERCRMLVADLLLSVSATVTDYHVARAGMDASAMEYQKNWGMGIMSEAGRGNVCVRSLPHCWPPLLGCSAPQAVCGPGRGELRGARAAQRPDQPHAPITTGLRSR